MARHLDNWLKSYLDYTKEFESPDSFFLWGGLAVLSAVAKRNVWLNAGWGILYPNIYAIFVAPAGKAKKSTALKYAKHFMRASNVILSSDSMSREKLIEFMSKAEEYGQSSVAVVVSELSDVLDTSSITMIQFLTTIYEGPDEWAHSTISRKDNRIIGPNLTLLGATTPSWLGSNSFPVETTEHGFTARTVFIYEPGARFPRAMPPPPDENLGDRLVADLLTISELKGQFTLAPDALEWYNTWYEKNFEADAPDFRLQSYFTRKGTHLLKIAMLRSLSVSDDLRLTVEDFESAEKVLNNAEDKMARAFSATGRYEKASDLERIWKEIERGGEVTFAELMERNYTVGSDSEIKEILSTLRTMGKVKTEGFGAEMVIRSATAAPPAD